MAYTEVMTRLTTLLCATLAAFGVSCSSGRDARDIDEGGGDDGTAPVGVGPSVGAGETSGGGPKRGPEYCPDVPTGYVVGEQVNEVLPDYQLRHCDGSEASLSEVCGAEGLFLFAAQGWCTVCQFVSINLEEIQAEYASQGLATVLVLTEDTSAGEPPDGDLCDIWRTQSPHEDVLTLYDPNGTLSSLWGGGSSQSAFIDRDRVIRSKLVGVGGLDELRAEIDAMLNVN